MPQLSRSSLSHPFPMWRKACRNRVLLVALCVVVVSRLDGSCVCTCFVLYVRFYADMYLSTSLTIIVGYTSVSCLVVVGDADVLHLYPFLTNHPNEIIVIDHGQ